MKTFEKTALASCKNKKVVLKCSVMKVNERESNMNNSLFKKTVRIVKKASRIMIGVDFSITEKDSPVNIVTSADTAVQAYLQKHLTAILPGSAFLGEEEPNKKQSCEFLWVVDPIDGTTNFARGISDCAISVALLKNGEAVLGVVYSPRSKELFTAQKGKGARLNGKPISVSKKSFSQSLFCTAFSLYQKEYGNACISLLSDVYGECNDFRRFGACSMELCYLAAGRCDLYFEVRLFPWDYAAGILILREAGGFASALGGSEIPYDSISPIIAANTRENFEHLKEKVSQYIPEITYDTEL